ncbi:ComEC/Rec2 family competence protein [Clostridium sp. AL.422]|uniref:ComEC/Rec2 family competence protein n=1 Tax=Clostridium TaxID=1485 RepID=UPI00293DED34|nr:MULTISPECIES: ComEC/Rec2 family competence protein [unclassified Clostridium]MDV4150484.1 ComEC/Rec2 family competence protein [Clostridium sp. AL.422]
MIRKFKLIKKLQNILILLLIILSIFLIKELFKNNSSNSNEIKVHFIDVGQGDAVLIQVNNKNLLIDSGSRSEKNKLIKYLDSIYIPQFDYVIATHPHEDHIGNMNYIINNYKIINFYSPKAQSNTSAFESMAESLSRKNLKIKILKANNSNINLGKNTLVEVFSPSVDVYDNLNNYSPIIKISYGNNSFLFTGDAEEDTEEEVINKAFNLKSDILKIGHHGSSTSTSKNFLDKVNPKITIISVGEDNSYGHPSEETLEKIEDTKIYRTDINGSIIITSDGKSIKTSLK